jgi:hypothetical protein
MSGQNVQKHSGEDTSTGIAARILAALRSVNGNDAAILAGNRLRQQRDNSYRALQDGRGRMVTITSRKPAPVECRHRAARGNL